MRLAELSRTTGVPRSTIKFYLREGLLPSGEAQARNQALYGPRHVERLELIRALREVAGLPLEVVGRITRELDRGWEGDPFGEAMRAVDARAGRKAARPAGSELAALRTEVARVLDALPWSVDDPRHAHVDEIAEALFEVRRHLFPDYPVESLARYAEVAWLLSETEFALVPGGAPAPLEARGDDLSGPMRTAILGSVLFERIFNALRRRANGMRSTRIARRLEVPPAR
jgi:DNA-binding transcriptional MerR regulator